MVKNFRAVALETPRGRELCRAGVVPIDYEAQHPNWAEVAILKPRDGLGLRFQGPVLHRHKRRDRGRERRQFLAWLVVWSRG